MAAFLPRAATDLCKEGKRQEGKFMTGETGRENYDATLILESPRPPPPPRY